MPSIEFYYMPESMPSRTVEMVANIIGVTLNKHHVNLIEKEQFDEENLKINPLHKVPFIIDGDLKINESRAIITYLMNRYAPENYNSLYPKDPVERARVDELLYIDLGLLHASWINTLRPVVFGDAKEIDPEADRVYREVLTYLDQRLANNGGKKFMLGDELTIADISIVSSFAFPEAFGYDFSAFKNLTPYLDRLKSSIPNYDELNSKPNENLKKFIKAKIEGKL